jgi:hypothetical protein
MRRMSTLLYLDLNSWVLLVRVPVEDVMADGVHEMGFPQPDASPDEERIVGLPRRLRHGETCRVGQPVGLSNHEGVEKIARVESSAGFSGAPGYSLLGPFLFVLFRFRPHPEFDVIAFSRLPADADKVLQKPGGDLLLHEHVGNVENEGPLHKVGGDAGFKPQVSGSGGKGPGRFSQDFFPQPVEIFFHNASPHAENGTILSQRAECG